MSSHQEQPVILITGCAGFIGSHIAQGFLEKGWSVRGLDNFYAGKKDNINFLEGLSTNEGNGDFTFLEGDIRDLDICMKASQGVGFVSHHAAIGSVVKSIEDPEFVSAVNVDGFRNIITACENNEITRLVYASSCAIYGDAGNQAISESVQPHPLSPYAEGKLQNETDAANSSLECIGFRYFNIYGAKQDPKGDYAAVIPKWVLAMKESSSITIFGDGENTRDFCHVKDVVRANILACELSHDDYKHSAEDKNNTFVCNIGSGKASSLNQLFEYLKNLYPSYEDRPIYEDFRAGDIRCSTSNISLAHSALNFKAQISLEEGLKDV